MTAPTIDSAPATESSGFSKAIFPSVPDTPAPVEESTLAPETPNVPDTGTTVPDVGTPTTGRPRDPATGKFVKSDGAVAADPVSDPAQAAIPETEAATVPPNEPAPFTLPDGTPWGVKVDGQDWSFDGAKVIPGVGVVIPEGQLDALHKVVGRGIKYDIQRARDQQEMHAEREAMAQEKEALRLQGDYFAKLANMAPEQILREAMNLRAEMPRLRTEAEKETLRRQLDARERADRPSPEVLYAQAVTNAEPALREIVAEIRKGPLPQWANGLTDGDWSDIAADLIATKRLFVQQAQEAIEEAGIQQGEWALHELAARERVEALGKVLKARRDETAAERKKLETAQANAARLQPSVTAPPSVAGNPQATPTKQPDAPPVFKTREEWLRWVNPTLA